MAAEHGMEQHMNMIARIATARASEEEEEDDLFMIYSPSDWNVKCARLACADNFACLRMVYIHRYSQIKLGTSRRPVSATTAMIKVVTRGCKKCYTCS
jgi:hypothetical protein